MTERRPAGMSFESWVDVQIREAMERGEFDDLPGKGKPIADLGRPRDDLWWIKDKLRRENLSLLPPALQLKKDLEDARRAIAAAPSEREVQRIVEELNERIIRANRTTTSGPPTTLMPLDLDRELARWRAAGGEAPPADLDG
ncbi:MAG TPA: DUF1992 domain-containing protein [Nitriliruptorales bacterium]